jgi:SAM-dependent methyltransferase
MALVFPYLPEASSAQYHALQQLVDVLGFKPSVLHEPASILDLGCGSGDGYYDLLGTGLDFEWVGLDIPDSPEASMTKTDEPNILTYNGYDIPFADGRFDIVYARQVFEHVRRPERLISEVARVLKEDGLFLGSTSHLEPFHSRSLWNFTPYGFATLMRDAGFVRICVRPGVDGLYLMLRRLLGFLGVRMKRSLYGRESPFNRVLELTTRMLRFDARRRAAVKLLFCGHFVFSGSKVNR